MTFKDRENINSVFSNSVDDSVGPNKNLADVASPLLAHNVTCSRKTRCAHGGSEQLIDPSRGRDGIVSSDVVIDLFEIYQCTFSPDELMPATCRRFACCHRSLPRSASSPPLGQLRDDRGVRVDSARIRIGEPRVDRRDEARTLAQGVEV